MSVPGSLDVRSTANGRSIDTVGVHYSGTLWRWYRNWVGNGDNVKAKYGQRWYRVSLHHHNP